MIPGACFFFFHLNFFHDLACPLSLLLLLRAGLVSSVLMQSDHDFPLVLLDHSSCEKVMTQHHSSERYGNTDIPTHNRVQIPARIITMIYHHNINHILDEHSANVYLHIFVTTRKCISDIELFGEYTGQGRPPCKSTCAKQPHPQQSDYTVVQHKQSKLLFLSGRRHGMQTASNL